MEFWEDIIPNSEIQSCLSIVIPANSRNSSVHFPSRSYVRLVLMYSDEKGMICAIEEANRLAENIMREREWELTNPNFFKSMQAKYEFKKLKF